MRAYNGYKQLNTVLQMYAVVGSKTTDVNVVACKMKAIQRVKTVLILLQIISN